VCKWRTGHWNPEREATTLYLAGIVEVLCSDSALVRFNDAAAQIQANPHTFDFGREKGLI
jgi:hypothetical protein